MLNIHHYFPLGSGNVGDHLVARALRTTMLRYFGPARFVDMPVNDRYSPSDREIGLRGSNIAASKRSADLVLVGGSNLLEARKPRRAGRFAPRRGRWGIFTDVESLEELNVPVLCAGMGNGSDFGKAIRPYREPAVAEICRLHEKALAATVRDEPTRRQLASIGVNAECTGCPVTFWTDRPVTRGDDNQPLIVSFPSTALANHFFGRRFLAGVKDYLVWLNLTGERFLVALHDDRDLKHVDQYLPTGVEPFFSTDVNAIVDRYERSRGVIGFRLHAALLGMGLGKPIVPVGVDWRGLGFIETFGLQEQSIRSHRFGQFTKLRRLTEQLFAGADNLVTPLADAKAHFLAKHHRWFADAADKFAANRRARAA